MPDLQHFMQRGYKISQYIISVKFRTVCITKFLENVAKFRLYHEIFGKCSEISPKCCFKKFRDILHSRCGIS
jgi:hypothetical protein